MPRRAPDKVVEHRMSLSTQSSKLMREAIDAQKKASLLKGVGSVGNSLGTVAIAGGVGLAAYAFFSWSGAILPKITDKVKDLSGDLGNYVIKNTEAGQNLESMLERLYRQNKEKNERTQEQVDNLDLIINDPNSSANQVSAATAEKARIIAKAKKRNQAFQKALKDQNLIP
jgi:hypothetical protein